MARVKVCCQTIVWGSKTIQQALDRVLGEVRDSGYAGVEIGARHLDLDNPADLVERLRRHNLELVGLHVGGDYLNAGAAADDVSRARQVVGAISAAGGQFIMVSGAKTDSSQGFAEEAARLGRIASISEGLDVKVCYHNHFWEITNDYGGLREICAATDADQVGLALDLGWVFRAGGDPGDAIRLFWDRIEVFHFKDVKRVMPKELDLATATSKEVVEATEVGAGAVDWAAVVTLIKSHPGDWWVVEQDDTDRAPADSARQSREYLRKHFGI